jgi:hypothetical protein
MQGLLAGILFLSVPAVVVPPWARANHVTSVVHDHTSILAMDERKWNAVLHTLTPLGAALIDANPLTTHRD